MSEFEREQIRLISRHTPYSMTYVETVFECTGKSFDKTVEAIELQHANLLTILRNRAVNANTNTIRASLWNTLKAELEVEARGINRGEFKAAVVETEESKRAADFLERMRRMEDRS